MINVAKLLQWPLFVYETFDKQTVLWQSVACSVLSIVVITTAQTSSANCLDLLDQVTGHYHNHQYHVEDFLVDWIKSWGFSTRSAVEIRFSFTHWEINVNGMMERGKKSLFEPLISKERKDNFYKSDSYKEGSCKTRSLPVSSCHAESLWFGERVIVVVSFVRSVVQNCHFAT